MKNTGAFITLPSGITRLNGAEIIFHVDYYIIRRQADASTVCSDVIGTIAISRTMFYWFSG